MIKRLRILTNLDSINNSIDAYAEMQAKCTSPDYLTVIDLALEYALAYAIFNWSQYETLPDKDKKKIDAYIEHNQIFESKD
jgi:hypothetical protein